MDKTRSAVQVLDEIVQLRARVAELEGAISKDISDAQIVCGGDGMGCPAFRKYYEANHERRYAKCDRCPMNAVFNIRAALAKVKEGEK